MFLERRTIQSGAIIWAMECRNRESRRKDRQCYPNPQFCIQAGFGNSFEYIFDGQTQQYFLTENLQTAGKRGKKIDLARANAALSEIRARL